MKKILAAASLLALAGAAQAQLSLTGGKPVTFSGYSSGDILGTGPVSSGLENSTLFADFTGTLSVTFLGKEASHLDKYTFTLGNLTTMTISNTDPVPTTISGVVNAGALNFTFKDVTDGAVVTNGVANQSGYASFAVLGTFRDSVFTPNTAGGAYTYVLGFNDGDRGDADYDDLVVGINLTPVAAVPETADLCADVRGARRRRRHGSPAAEAAVSKRGGYPRPPPWDSAA